MTSDPKSEGWLGDLRERLGFCRWCWRRSTYVVTGKTDIKNGITLSFDVHNCDKHFDNADEFVARYLTAVSRL